MTRNEIMSGLRERGWYRPESAIGIYYHPDGGSFDIDRFSDGSVGWQKLGDVWPVTTGTNEVAGDHPLPFTPPAKSLLQAAIRALNEHHCDLARERIEEAIGLL